jgi:hypothetical protein
MRTAVARSSQAQIAYLMPLAGLTDRPGAFVPAEAGLPCLASSSFANPATAYAPPDHCPPPQPSTLAFGFGAKAFWLPTSASDRGAIQTVEPKPQNLRAARPSSSIERPLPSLVVSAGLHARLGGASTKDDRFKQCKCWKDCYFCAFRLISSLMIVSINQEAI